MGAQEVIRGCKELSRAERAQVAKFVLENDDSWIPEEFKLGMDDIAAGRVVDLDTALNEPYPGDKRAIASEPPNPFGAVGASCHENSSR